MNKRHSFALLGAALALASAGACGSEPSDAATGDALATVGTDADTAPTSTARGGGGPGAGALAFAQCMRDEGVTDFPDPQIDGGRVMMTPGVGDPNDPEFVAAEEACRPLMAEDTGAAVDVDEEREAEVREGALAFAECMREQGVDMPDPQVDGGRVIMRAGSGGGSGPAPGSPEFEAAQQECQGLMPEPPQGNG